LEAALPLFLRFFFFELCPILVTQCYAPQSKTQITNPENLPGFALNQQNHAKKSFPMIFLTFWVGKQK